MKTSCIPTPAYERMVIIHQWQVDFCEGNHCAAALLQFFIYWHDIKLAMQEKNQQANGVAESHGQSGTQDVSLYQFHSREELKEGLLDLYSNDSIKQGKDLLVAKGVITVHRNPNPKYTYDNTAHFLLHPANLLNFLINRKTVGPATENHHIVHGKPVHCAMENRGTIPEITTETTTESCLIPPSALTSNGNGASLWPSVEILVEMYNTLAPEECPAVMKISPGRRKLAKQALTAFPDQSFWERVFRMMGKSPVLRGLRPTPGHENWIADFDWILAKKDGVENYMKIHDGRYIG